MLLLHFILTNLVLKYKTYIEKMFCSYLNYYVPGNNKKKRELKPETF